MNMHLDLDGLRLASGTNDHHEPVIVKDNSCGGKTMMRPVTRSLIATIMLVAIALASTVTPCNAQATGCDPRVNSGCK